MESKILRLIGTRVRSHSVQRARSEDENETPSSPIAQKLLEIAAVHITHGQFGREDELERDDETDLGSSEVLRCMRMFEDDR